LEKNKNLFFLAALQQHINQKAIRLVLLLFCAIYFILFIALLFSAAKGN